MAMVAAEAAGVAAESAGVGAGDGAVASAGGAATRGAGKGGGQLGKAMGAAGAPRTPPGSRTGQGSGRGAYRGKSVRQKVDQLGSDRRRVKSVTPKIRPLNFRDPRKIILAEFLVCVVIAGLRPFAKDDPKSVTEGTFVQFSAIAALFFTLALMTSGKKSGNVAAAFGGLVTLGVLFRNQKVFAELGKFFKAQSIAESMGAAAAAGAGGGIAESMGGAASDALGDTTTGVSGR